MQTRQNSSAPITSAVTNLSHNNGTRQEAVPPPSAVAQFLAARQMLYRRRQELEKELEAIRDALGPATPQPDPCAPQENERPLQPRRNRGELTAAIMEILKGGPLEKDQIIERFQAQTPGIEGGARKAVDSVLYSKRFRRDGKLFSIALNAVLNAGA